MDSTPVAPVHTKQRTCLIIEDTPAEAALLQEYLSRMPSFLPPVVCTTIPEAIERLHQQQFDLIFLDMHLHDQLGLDLLRAFPRPLPVVVTTSHPEFAVESFDLNVVDYLLKPFTYPRFLRALNRVLSLPATATPAPAPSAPAPQSIYLKVGHNVQRFDFADIDYIQAFGIYCKVVHQSKVTVVNQIISNLEGLLPAPQFLRIHKSYLINVAKMTSYGHRTVGIGSVSLPIGAAYRDKFTAAMVARDKNK